jgi:endonuclease/exonuclease/phosphatase family metal-dependent hydrolase
MKINVLSYNIHKGFNWLNSAEVLAEIRDAIRSVDADICCLQEILGEGRVSPLIAKLKGNNSIVQPETQLEYLADTIWKHYSYGKNAVFPNRHHGNAILTKYPVLEFENIDLTQNQWEMRGLLYCKINLEEAGKVCHFFNTHLNLLEKSRLKQVELIIRTVQALPRDEPLILAGDFNDWTGQISEILKTRTNLQEVHFPHRKKVATFPSFFPMLQLDRIFYRGCNLLDMEVLDSEPWMDLSDHIPLFAQFAI